MKKTLICTLAALFAVATIAGCSSNTTSSSASSTVSSEAPVSSEVAAVDVSISEVHEAVKAAYGDNYVPSMPFEEPQLKELFGVNTDNVEEFILEGPMMSAHIDMFAAVKAKEGKGEEVESELNAYRDMLVSDTMQYPSNLAKIAASQVIRHGDYVFFVMLGAFNEDMEATEDEQAKFAQDQTQIGVDAINAFFA